jgi:hypothetical protein
MALPLSGLTIDTCVVALQLLRVSAEAALREVTVAAQPVGEEVVPEPPPAPEPPAAPEAPDGQ